MVQTSSDFVCVCVCVFEREFYFVTIRNITIKYGKLIFKSFMMQYLYINIQAGIIKGQIVSWHSNSSRGGQIRLKWYSNLFVV